MSRYALAEKYEWKQIFRTSETDATGEFYGHTYFRDVKSGMVAVCDMSGDYPHMTDDGVLWVDREKPIALYISESDNKMRASIPLISQRRIEGGKDAKTSTGDPPLDAIKLAMLLGMRIEVLGNLAEVLEMLTPKILQPTVSVTFRKDI